MWASSFSLLGSPDLAPQMGAWVRGSAYLHLRLWTQQLETMEVSQYVLEVFEDEKRQGFSKEAYFEPSLRNDDWSFRGSTSLAGCHDPWWDIGSFHWDLTSNLWNFSPGVRAPSRAGTDKTIKFCLCASNILSLPKLSPKGVVKCHHVLGTAGQPFQHEQEGKIQRKGSSGWGRLAQISQLGRWKRGLCSLNSEGFSSLPSWKRGDL